jgi:hypothetical protein
MLRPLALCAVLALAACASPAQVCRSNATRDLARLDRMIAETEDSLARGYRLIRIPDSGDDFLDCVLDDDEDRGAGECLADSERPDYLRQEINVPAEQAKLASLRQQRGDEVRRAQAALASCPAA